MTPSVNVAGPARKAGWLVLTVRLMRIKTMKEARAVFWFSNYYLALIFAAMVLDRVFH